MSQQKLPPRFGGEECPHHWMIEPATGPTSLGECAHCHEVREFKNSFPDPDPVIPQRHISPEEERAISLGRAAQRRIIKRSWLS